MATQGARPAEPSGDPEDPKERFREALARKRGKQAERAAADAHGDSKVHAAHGAEGSKRVFRRKSG